MKNFPNIEKFRHVPYYTGYAGGVVYYITKIQGGGWRAKAACDSAVHGVITRNTLEGISKELANRA